MNRSTKIMFGRVQCKKIRKLFAGPTPARFVMEGNIPKPYQVEHNGKMVRYEGP